MAEIEEIAAQLQLRYFQNKKWAITELGRIIDGELQKDEHGDPAIFEKIRNVAGPALRMSVKEWNPFVSTGAIRQLGKLRDSEAVPDLIECLEDHSYLVRVAASGALANIGDMRAEKPLLGKLASEDWRDKGSAAGALGILGSHSAVPKLIPILNAEVKEVKEAAGDALVRIGEASVAHLAELLEETNGEKKKTVIGLLAKIGEPALPVLMTCIAHPNFRTRWMASEALAKSDCPAATMLLIKALDDETRIVRESAAKTLAKRGDLRAVRHFVGLLASTNPEDRDGCFELLKEMLDKCDTYERVEEFERRMVEGVDSVRKDHWVGSERLAETLFRTTKLADVAAKKKNTFVSVTDTMLDGKPRPPMAKGKTWQAARRTRYV